MQFRNARCVAAAVPLLLMQVCTCAQSTSVTVDAAKLGPKIGKTHYGIFFEEINHAGETGLWAELIKNKSFEDSATSPDGWQELSTGGATGSIAVDTAAPLNPNNPLLATYNNTEAAITITSPGSGKYGIYNAGFFSLPVTAGKGYVCTIFTRKDSAFTGKLLVTLEDESGNPLASATISKLTPDWKKFEFKLKPNKTTTNARLAITSNAPGKFYLTYVSLMPSDALALGGFRPDIYQKIKDLRPGFVRFPGGCFVEGDELEHAWRWKRSVGPQENRFTYPGYWGYQVSNALGYMEYLRLSEKLKAEPLLVVNCGFYHTGPTSSTGITNADPRLQELLQEALDAIEYANGDVNTKWGAQRARDGHPKPFNLKYMEIGNENWGQTYIDNYALFYDAIKAKYPYMQLIANAWGGGNYPKNRGVPDLIDEHYYDKPTWFINQKNKYDSYDRKGPKIYVGEYAVTQDCGKGNLRAGLGEAYFMMGMERNADIVTMSCYAPMFVNRDAYTKPYQWYWNPDMIPFNATSSHGTPSYYVQKMMAENCGDVVLSTQVTGDIDAIATKDDKTGDVMVKIVNSTSSALDIPISISNLNWSKVKAKVTTLTSASDEDENSLTEPTKVSPVEKKLSGLSLPFNYKIEPYSLTILRLSKAK